MQIRNFLSSLGVGTKVEILCFIALCDPIEKRLLNEYMEERVGEKKDNPFCDRVEF